MTVEQRWPRVEQPILDALAAGDGSSSMRGDEIERVTGLDHVEVMHALRSLKEDDYIDALLVEADQEAYPIMASGVRLRPKGLRKAGLWPASDDLGEAFLAALEKAINDEPEGEERTRLERVLGAAQAVGKVALSAAVAQAVGIGIGHM